MVAPVRGRGRSRGQGGRGSRKPGGRFASSRLKDSSEEPQDPIGDFETQSEEEISDLSAHDSESEPEPKFKPYNALLGVFNISSEKEEHRRKRRKVDSNTNQLKEGSNGTQPYNGEDEHSVSEPDEEPGVELEETQDALDGEDDEDDTGNPSDPFDIHFSNPDESTLANQIAAITEKGWHVEKRDFGMIGKCQMYTPNDDQQATERLTFGNATINSLSIKKRLLETAQRAFPEFDDTEKAMVPFVFGYKDVLFGGRTVENASKLRSMICLHALNHIFKTRDRVLKNSARLAKEDAEHEMEHRDQGFTRPKVLIIVPTRQSCVRMVNSIIDLCEPEQQENRKRFEDGYVQDEGRASADRPADFQELFEGNDDDMFRLGIKFTRKTVKFFTQFYNSDIIFASPLGLRRAIDSGDIKKQDSDFLSSIELLLVDQTDALLMQNWEHIAFIMSHLNLQPRAAHGCDFSRVRNWYLDGRAKYLRQTIVLSAFISPEINALFNTSMTNIAGKVKYQPTFDGSMLTTGFPIKQSFSRFNSPNLSSDPDARFKFFTSTIVPWILRSPKPPDGALGIAIFIPSYFDFVRLRNYFSTSPTVSSIPFGSLSENSTPAEPAVRRTRSHFLFGKHSVLLYSGRAHHFYRYLIKGVKSVVIYQIPDNPLFYKEAVAGYLGASIDAGRISGEEGKARVLFSKWDALRLERVVGSERLRSMLTSGGDTFEFI